MKQLLIADFRYNEIVDVPVIQFPEDRNKLDQLLLGFNRIANLDNLFPVIKASSTSKQGTERYQTPFQALTVVDLKENALKQVPTGILLLPALKVLDVSNNDLASLPCKLGYLLSLNVIRADGNGLRKIRRELLISGAEKLKEYLRSRDPDPAEPVSELFEAHLTRRGKTCEQAEQHESQEARTTVTKVQTRPGQNVKCAAKLMNSVPVLAASKSCFDRNNDNVQAFRQSQNTSFVKTCAVKEQGSVSVQSSHSTESLVEEKENIEREINHLEKEMEINFNVNKFRKQEMKHKLIRLRAALKNQAPTLQST